MNECVKSSLSDDLLVAYGEKTKELAGRLSFVPTITINGVSTRHYEHVSSIRARLIANRVSNVNSSCFPSVAGDTKQGAEQFL